eukprot:CAMPEP_0119297122 /NCGR_PEP_ID=MMETSP1329-20130426/50917_1 /TAXON_ID=114041 /ORGANISM="Genus nov. species nov., Strain RCC1024" /LENGTH=241 /DNA_ID=CAMNT_0007298063 /DNA_START=1020 /DNA_END=1745 /DNA_ORIENTATION=+
MAPLEATAGSDMMLLRSRITVLESKIVEAEQNLKEALDGYDIFGSMFGLHLKRCRLAQTILEEARLNSATPSDVRLGLSRVRDLEVATFIAQRKAEKLGLILNCSEVRKGEMNESNRKAGVELQEDICTVLNQARDASRDTDRYIPASKEVATQTKLVSGVRFEQWDLQGVLDSVKEDLYVCNDHIQLVLQDLAAYFRGNTLETDRDISAHQHMSRHLTGASRDLDSAFTLVRRLKTEFYG